MHVGSSGWKYSDDSLWMNVGRSSTSMIASIARMFAWQRCFTAVTNARSLLSRSFHQPFKAENIAVTKISLTGV